MKKMRKRYRLSALVAVPFFAVCALLAAVMPGASAASASAQSTSSPMTAVKLADSAAATSVATRSTAPSSPQGPKTRHVHPHGVDTCVATLIAYPEIQKTTKTVLCSLVAVAAHTHNQNAIAVATAACVGGFIALNVDSIIAVTACALAASSEVPFTEEQWCENTAGVACLNAWGGGPWVNVYTGGPETRDPYQKFFLVNENGSANGSGYDQLRFAAAGNSWSGDCIGDAYNNPNNADTSLVPCGSASGGQGWGTNLTVGTGGCPSGEMWFRDAHWGGYLGPPAGAVNGSHFYLNKPSPYCFSVAYVS